MSLLPDHYSEHTSLPSKMSQAMTEATSTLAETDVHVLLPAEVIFEVLAHLDFHSLLTCQRVCRTWASVISRSREAQQRLFLTSDDEPFKAFKAAEEHDIATRAPAAWQRPAERVRQRPEFRALFNPWIFMQDCDPIASTDPVSDWMSYYSPRRPSICWRFTDRVSSGRLDFCYIPANFVSMVDATQASWNQMFLTQPPVKRVLLSVQGGYLPEEKFDIEKEAGVKIGDVMEKVRSTKAVKIMRGRKGDRDFTTVDMKFDEHFTGARFMPLQQLVEDEFQNVNTITI